MIHLPASVRVYLCLTACDMRKSFDSLQALVRDYLELDAYAGHLFVFASRRRDRVKILYWGVSRMQVQTCRAVPKMGVGPPGVGFQELVSNHPELLRSKGVVVNVCGKGIREDVR